MPTNYDFRHKFHYTLIVHPLAAQSHAHYTWRRIRTIWPSSSSWSSLPRPIYYKYAPRVYARPRCMSRKFFKTIHDPVAGHIVRERVWRRRTRLYCLRCGGGGVVLTIRQRRDLPLDIHCGGGGGGGTCVTLRRHVTPRTRRRGSSKDVWYSCCVLRNQCLGTAVGLENYPRKSPSSLRQFFRETFLFRQPVDRERERERQTDECYCIIFIIDRHVWCLCCSRNERIGSRRNNIVFEISPINVNDVLLNVRIS